MQPHTMLTTYYQHMSIYAPLHCEIFTKTLTTVFYAFDAINIETHCTGAFKFINNACKKTLQK